MSPGSPPDIGSVTKLRGKAGKPSPGFTGRYHYEASSKARVDYEFHQNFDGGARGDEHAVVRILTINFSSH